MCAQEHVTTKVWFVGVAQAIFATQTTVSKVKMSAIVSGILNSTVGLLCSKLRDYTAQRLREGDLSDDKCRQIIVRELDDIKSKLDGFSRKDLLASLSFFKEGVTRLYNSLETSGEAHTEDEYEIEGATATTFEQFSVTQAERDALESSFDLSEAIGNLKIASQGRFKLAKESFKESKRLATEAFNNVALSTEDRLMACKLRIASRILEGFDDAEAAVRDCLLYLKELQDLPAVQAMFSVWRGSDKGITSRLRARFNKKERNVNIESIQMINALLIDLVMKFINIKMGLFNWPTIKIGTKFYHPLFDDYALRMKIEDKEEQSPWFWRFDKNLDLCSYCLRIGLTSKGEILSITADRQSLISLEMTKKSAQSKLFCTIPSENDKDKIHCFAVDENDNVYIIVLSIHGYTLLIFDANGNHKEERHLKGFKWLPPKISVPKDGLIVLYCQLSTTMYIYDIHVKEDYKFLVPFQDAKPENTLDEVNITVSSKNDIILSFVTRGSDKLFIYVLTMNGQLKRRVQEPVTLHSKASRHLNVISNDINETVIVSFYTDISGKDDSDSNDDNDDWSISIDLKKPHTTILTLCPRTGVLVHQHHTLGCYPHMTSHPSGYIVLANNDKAIILRM